MSLGLESVQFAGTGGRAEYEIIGAETFYVKNDTINILDGGNYTIKIYLPGQFIGSYPLPDGLDKRFFIDINGDLFMPVRSEKGTFYRKQQGVEEIEYYG